MAQIKLKKLVKDEQGNYFKAGSIMQIMTEASKNYPYYDLYPVKAIDEENLPYPVGNKLYTVALKADEYEKQSTDTPIEKISFSIGGLIEDEDKVESMSLKAMFEDSNLEWNMDGEVKKKSEKEDDKIEKEECKDVDTTGKKKTAETQENTLTESKDDITTDFDPSIDGSGTVTDCYKADEKEMPATPPLMGKINMMEKKVADLKKEIKAVIEDNRLTESKDDITTDFDASVGGSGTVTDCYTEKQDNNEAKPPILGELPK